MIRYSVKIQIEKASEDEWVEYMKGHIAQVLDSGHFIDFGFYKKPLEFEENGYSIYQIDYIATSMEEYKAYEANGAAQLKADHEQKFQGKFVASRDVFEDIFKQVFKKPKLELG